MDYISIERHLLGDLWTSPDLLDDLAYLCDACHGRFAGTEDERRAGDYLLGRLRAHGLENVAAEPFEMRGWQRGPAELTLLTGAGVSELPCLGLPGTPPAHLEAEIVDAGLGTAAEFARLGPSLAGKIVLVSSDGPGRAEKYQSALEAGAAAFIFSNAQPGLLAPTGSIDKDLPAVGLAYEHAAQIKRRLAAGPLQARLSLQAHILPLTARNIVGEIPGTDPSQGWILAGGHYDGHDIAQGAHDNAASVAALLEAARLLSPQRAALQAGLRFVFFSGEELGLFGSHAYAQAHAAELDQLRLVLNADVLGAAMPVVLMPQGSPELADALRALPLAELDAVVNDGPRSFIMNSDHFPFTLAGLQSVWALTSHPASGQGWGHTRADTLDKVEPRLLRQTAASLTRILLRLAAEPGRLPRGRRPVALLQQILADAGFEKALRASGRWPE